MADTKISAATDIATLNASDKFPVARAADTTAYSGTIAEVLTYAEANFQKAAAGTFGVCKVDNTSITAAAGVISVQFASPPAIGGTSPAAGSFTTLSASSTVSGAGFTTYLASPPAIGGTVAAAGSFTTLAASGAISGAGFTAWLASPPAIGGTAPAAVTATTLTVGSTTGPTWTVGAGAPVATQPLGSLYSRTDGGVGTTLYVSQGGGTWNPISGV